MQTNNDNSISNYKEYQDLYNFSVNQPEQFWDKCAQQYLDWFNDYDQVYTGNIKSISSQTSNTKSNQWFSGGSLNACFNCLDRHLENNSNKIAYFWQGDEAHHKQSVTYLELYEKVCVFSNVLKKLGVNKGDRICIYLPISIEAITAMLACARIGAVHTVVFAGFSAHALADRILDAECKLVIATDIAHRGGKSIPIWEYCEQAIDITVKNNANLLEAALLVPNFYSNDNFINSQSKKIKSNAISLFNYQNLAQQVDQYCEAERMNSEDPLFILYTSGSTGKPKGVLHTTAGYLLHTAYSFKLILDIKPDDVYWCSADIGWVAGHSYVVYGALLNATTSVIYSGTPSYPDYDVFWKLIDKYKVSIFYTAPTALRALMHEGNEYLKSTSRDSLRLLATVGEPINSECWQWYYDYVGKQNCPVIDTWWQTETGAAMLSPYASLGINKPGCAMLPFMGINLAILDHDGKEIVFNKTTTQGHLVIRSPWPGMMRTVYNNHEKFTTTYLKPYKNYFYTGDIAKRDQDGHYWLLGRSDDVINIAGHRLGTAEIESALASHDLVAEAAAIAIPDDIKGQALYAFVVLAKAYSKADTNDIIKQLKTHVRAEIGPIAIIKIIDIVAGLPKTRSGKIMRRILKKIADYKINIQNNKLDNIELSDIVNKLELGDTSTLTNPEVIKDLI